MCHVLSTATLRKLTLIGVITCKAGYHNLYQQFELDIFLPSYSCNLTCTKYQAQTYKNFAGVRSSCNIDMEVICNSFHQFATLTFLLVLVCYPLANFGLRLRLVMHIL